LQGGRPGRSSKKRRDWGGDWGRRNFKGGGGTDGTLRKRGALAGTPVFLQDQVGKKDVRFEKDPLKEKLRKAKEEKAVQ